MIKNKDLKNFALIWAAIFLIIGIYPLFKSGEQRNIPLIISVFFILTGLIKPQILTGFYKVWMKFGNFMGTIISRIVLFILFFVLFTPISIILKLIGIDLLNKKIDKNTDSYWAVRETQPESMKKQF